MVVKKMLLVCILLVSASSHANAVENGHEPFDTYQTAINKIKHLTVIVPQKESDDEYVDSERVKQIELEKERKKERKKELEEKLSKIKYSLGNCKNKNMDNEIRNLEVLQEIESIKKELKVCF